MAFRGYTPVAEADVTWDNVVTNGGRCFFIHLWLKVRMSELGRAPAIIQSKIHFTDDLTEDS